jgi:hypothetical protein
MRLIFETKLRFRLGFSGQKGFDLFGFDSSEPCSSDFLLPPTPSVSCVARFRRCRSITISEFRRGQKHEIYDQLVLRNDSVQRGECTVPRNRRRSAEGCYHVGPMAWHKERILPCRDRRHQRALRMDIPMERPARLHRDASHGRC